MLPRLVLVLFILQSLLAYQIQNKKFKFASSFGEYDVRYQSAGGKGTPIICVHGFGGNADQFRYNMPAFAEAGCKPYAIDLLGYGYSDKPSPKAYGVNELYNFETWGEQITQFIEKEVKEPAILVCNSVGGVVGLQAAVQSPELVKGVILIDISLRLLHTKKQPPLQRPLTSALQTVLRETGIGKAFFTSVAKPDTLRQILGQAYASKSKEGVDDETLNVILEPGLQPGAAEVFLDFISYSGGPLPEELLPQVSCPVRILWGENDPWEPIELGKAYANYDCVDEFVTLPGGGHCPMDQIPDLVNTEVLRFVNDRFPKKKAIGGLFSFKF